ncbi:uncharacterized protein LOC122981752 isoform X2 [Thunnus albacares]|uniref:uncharacterized protein LOC122981752 isoform X2 n=1 Tax=Thunnus albacares TaxID=8236 RepID=UPI001CF66F7A|nr:uncharacterized protein LOC122981752 isoform X2 [Thunnus albacares]
MIFCIRIKLRMNIHHVLFFCFLSALQDGNTGLVNAINLFAGAEGRNGSIHCYFISPGSTKFFCKGECKEDDILIKTDDVTAQSGRYSIRYEDGSSGRRIVIVTITQLTKSDSGQYRCGLSGSSVPDAYWDFVITITDEAALGQNTRFIHTGTVGGNITYGCLNTVNGSRTFFCKDKCNKTEDILVETEENRAQNGRYSIEYREGSVFGLYVTITQLNKSDTGWYRCGYGRTSSADSSDTFPIFVVDAPTTSKPNRTLRPFPTSVPSASTPTTTQSLISSSGSFTPSSSFPETTEQFTALQDGNTGLVNAINLFAGAEGGSGSIHCYLTSSGSTKFFCKGECKEEDILIKTDDVTDQSGRYSIKYIDGSSGRRIVIVTITQLTKSDSGRYRCGLGGSSVPDAYWDFVITITDATLGDNTRFIRAGTVGGNMTRGCLDTVYGSRKFFCKDTCKKEEDILVETEENRGQNGRYSVEYRKGSVFGLYVTITQLKKSDTGWYRCGYGRALSPDSSNTFPIFVVDAVSDVSRPSAFWPLAVCVPVIVVVLAVVLLLLHKLRKRRNSGLNTRGTSDSRNMELCVTYENHSVSNENCPPVSTYEDNIYQSLNPDSRDLDQTYSTLTANT